MAELTTSAAVLFSGCSGAASGATVPAGGYPRLFEESPSPQLAAEQTGDNRRFCVLVKFTFERDPRQKALRGTLVSEVNFTGCGYPCQKCFRGRLDDLVKFTFGTDPRQNAFWGMLAFEVAFPERS